MEQCRKKCFADENLQMNGYPVCKHVLAYRQQASRVLLKLREDTGNSNVRSIACKILAKKSHLMQLVIIMNVNVCVLNIGWMAQSPYAHKVQASECEKALQGRCRLTSACFLRVSSPPPTLLSRCSLHLWDGLSPSFRDQLCKSVQKNTHTYTKTLFTKNSDEMWSTELTDVFD